MFVYAAKAAGTTDDGWPDGWPDGWVEPGGGDTIGGESGNGSGGAGDWPDADPDGDGPGTGDWPWPPGWPWSGLGFKIDLQAGPAVSYGGFFALAAEITDADGAPLATGLNHTLIVFAYIVDTEEIVPLKPTGLDEYYDYFWVKASEFSTGHWGFSLAEVYPQLTLAQLGESLMVMCYCVSASEEPYDSEEVYINTLMLDMTVDATATIGSPVAFSFTVENQDGSDASGLNGCSVLVAAAVNGDVRQVKLTAEGEYANSASVTIVALGGGEYGYTGNLYVNLTSADQGETLTTLVAEATADISDTADSEIQGLKLSLDLTCPVTAESSAFTILVLNDDDTNSAALLGQYILLTAAVTGSPRQIKLTEGGEWATSINVTVVALGGGEYGYTGALWFNLEESDAGQTLTLTAQNVAIDIVMTDTCTVDLTDLAFDIRERQWAFGIVDAWSEGDPANVAKLISLDYTYTLTQYKAYVNALCTGANNAFVTSGYTGGASTPTWLASTYANGAADVDELRTLVQAMADTGRAATLQTNTGQKLGDVDDYYEPLDAAAWVSAKGTTQTEFDAATTSTSEVKCAVGLAVKAWAGEVGYIGASKECYRGKAQVTGLTTEVAHVVKVFGLSEKAYVYTPNPGGSGYYGFIGAGDEKLFSKHGTSIADENQYGLLVTTSESSDATVTSDYLIPAVDPTWPSGPPTEPYATGHGNCASFTIATILAVVDWSFTNVT